MPAPGAIARPAPPALGAGERALHGGAAACARERPL